MPASRPLAPLNLRRLAVTDRPAAQLGMLLNTPQLGGASHDGDPAQLTYDEFLQGKLRLSHRIRHPDDLAALGRLQQAFLGVEPAGGSAPSGTGVLAPGAGRALVCAEELHRIGPGGAVDLTSALFLSPEGRAALVYETADKAFTHGELRVSPGVAGEPFGPGETLSGVGGRIQGAPSAVRVGGRDYLYWAEADDVQGSPRLFRREWTTEGFSPPETVAQPPGLGMLMGWPRVHAVPGGVAVAYRDSNFVPRLAFSPDGRRFTGSQVMGPQGAMADVEGFPGGGLAYSYQVDGGGGAMTSVFSVSSPDGSRWTPPARVTDASLNVHDTSFLSRADGGLDLYYIYPPGDGAGFSLFRRALRPDGSLGPEQRVTGPDCGEPSKPQARRLPNGRVLVTFADITRRDAQDQPAEQRLTSVVLDRDAP